MQVGRYRVGHQKEVTHPAKIRTGKEVGKIPIEEIDLQAQGKIEIERRIAVMGRLEVQASVHQKEILTGTQRPSTMKIYKDDNEIGVRYSGWT